MPVPPGFDPVDMFCPSFMHHLRRFEKNGEIRSLFLAECSAVNGGNADSRHKESDEKNSEPLLSEKIFDDLLDVPHNFISFFYTI